MLCEVADFTHRSQYGTQNFNLKTKYDMENKTSTNHENGNDANRLLAGCRKGELCIICGEGIDADYGSVCSDCDDSHLDDCR